jgi:hypothetical protein
MRKRLLLRPIFPSITLLVLGIARLAAAPVEFTIDEAQSSITMAGTVLGNPLREQGAGSLTTTFHGTIRAEVTGTGIQFGGGSTLTARTNGVWTPGPNGSGSAAPANYAAQASTILGTIKGALRHIVLDLTSSALPINNTQFDAAELRFAFLTNSGASFDYDAGFLGAKGIPLEGMSTNRIVNGATLVSTGDSQTLTIQVDTEFKFQAVVENDSSVRLTGKLVAKRTAQPVIAGMQITDGKVVIYVEGTGPEPRLESSFDLTQWSTREATRATNAGMVTLTAPLGGALQFYRVAK